MPIRASVVLGMGFGDEGKGVTTSYLASQGKRPVVIRFSGGQQAGHTVIHNGDKHTFSNFGSATLLGVPTVWSRWCTFCPPSAINEYDKLQAIGVRPELSIDPLCPVTTPFDVMANMYQDMQNNHGTCGMGVGQTWKRETEGHYHLYYNDLFFPTVFREKLALIAEWYKTQLPDDVFEKVVKQLTPFIESCHRCIQTFKLHNKFTFGQKKYDHIIMEGSQGILLDQDYGFFPHVTRSYTTSSRAMLTLHELSPALEEPLEAPTVYYVTRAYQTRHGNGYMTNEDMGELKLSNTEHEINGTNKFQGKFRKSVLDIDLLNYALSCDFNYSIMCKHAIVMTCIDQTGDVIRFTEAAKPQEAHIRDLAGKFMITPDLFLVGHGPNHGDIMLLQDYLERPKKYSYKIDLNKTTAAKNLSVN